jgi:putative transposase
MLRRAGWHVNTKRVYRIYREEQLQVRTAKRAKRPACLRVALPQPAWPNQRWSMDFVSDRFVDGRWFRILTVVDQYTRECLCAHADRAQTGPKVVEQMRLLVTARGAPESITTDNGGEFAGKAMETWAYQNDVKLDLIRPGKPVENGYIESFNGRLRDECLNWNAGGETTTRPDRTVRSTIEHLPRLRRLRDSGPSPSQLSIRQARNRVQGSLAPGQNRPPWTRPRSCL